MNRIFNVSTRRVGGVRFIKIGRLTLSFSVSREYRPLKGSAAHLELWQDAIKRAAIKERNANHAH